MEAGSNARHIRKATMKVEQLSIFLENKAGRLAQVTKTLAEAGINIRALSLADTSDFGILRLIVNDTEKAINIMKEAGFTVGRTAVVAVEVDDKPGGLNNILEALFRPKRQCGIHVRVRTGRRRQRYHDFPLRSYRSGHRSAEGQEHSDYPR